MDRGGWGSLEDPFPLPREVLGNVPSRLTTNPFLSHHPTPLEIGDGKDT